MCTRLPKPILDDFIATAPIASQTTRINNPCFANKCMIMRWRLLIAVDNFDGALLDEKRRSPTVIFSLSSETLEAFEEM